MLGLCENPGKYIIVSSLRHLLQLFFLLYANTVVQFTKWLFFPSR